MESTNRTTILSLVPEVDVESGSSGGGFRHFPRAVTVTAAACAIIFSIVGIAGNSVTVIALLRYTRLRRHATTAFVISLSVSDLIFSAVNLPLTASRYLSEAWVLGETLCRIFPLFFYGNVAVSLLSMVAITINRYVSISRSDLYPSLYTSPRIAAMLVAIWTTSFSLLLPPLLGFWGTLGLDTATFSCTILNKNGSSPKKFLFVLGFLVPCLVISVSYSCIYWKVRTSRKNLEAYATTTAAGASGKSTGSGGFQRREDSRVTRLMLIIFLCFLTCFMPLMLVNVVDDRVETPTLHVIASILAWASSVVNPFVYAGTNRLYREAYRRVLCPGSSSKGATATETGVVGAAVAGGTGGGAGGPGPGRSRSGGVSGATTTRRDAEGSRAPSPLFLPRGFANITRTVHHHHHLHHHGVAAPFERATEPPEDT